MKKINVYLYKNRKFEVGSLLPKEIIVGDSQYN